MPRPDRSPPGMSQPQMPQQQPCVLVGVHPGQPNAVVLEAARLAAALNCPLVCAYANPARFPVAEAADGTLVSEPVDPDFTDDDGARFPPRLMAELEGQLARKSGPGRLQWRTLLLAGDPAQALARCAGTIGATMIVVGTHGDSRTPLRELLHHSVAAQLTHKQHRPVLVVPTRRGPMTQGHQ